MAGMTVAMLGVPREKKMVASLKIYCRIVVSKRYKIRKIYTYLENVSNLVGNPPIAFSELVLSELHITICSDSIDGCDMLNGEVEHVECQIPAG
jgi:hypothetical protein